MTKGIFIQDNFIFIHYRDIGTADTAYHGFKQMEIRLADSATAEISNNKKQILRRGYTLTKQHGDYCQRNKYYRYVMNELKNFQGISDVKILKHWVERVFLAKKINLGLDLRAACIFLCRRCRH